MSEYTNNKLIKNNKNNSWTILYDFVKEKSRVLDIGCSSGNFGEALIIDKQCHVIGLDVNKDDIQIAKHKLSRAEVCDIEKDAIDKYGKFDYVVVADVLEHLAAPVSVLRKIKKVLKPNGKVLFSIPNMAHISTRLQILKGTFSYTPTGILDKTHLHFYDEEEVKHIFISAGFNIEILKPTTLYFPPQVIEKKLRDLGLNSTSKFLNHLSKSKADIYQFIGSSISTKKEKKHETKYTHPMDELKQELDRIEKLTGNHISNLNFIIESKDDEISKLKTELQKIESHPLLRLFNKIKNYKAR